MLITDIADFCLQYDEPLGLLRLEWVSGPATHSMQASAAKLLHVAWELRVRHLLLDMNTVPDIPADEETWLGTHWMPGIVQLPLERLVLVIDSFRVHNQLAIDALHDLVQPAIRFDVQYFSEPEAGLHWLTDESPRLPALLAEWNARPHRLYAPGAVPGPAPAPRHSLLAWPRPGNMATALARTDTPDLAL